MMFETRNERPSRAVNINVKSETIIGSCARNKREISAIEDLPGGGTRVVMCTLADAASLRLRFSRSLIKGPVERIALLPVPGY